MGANDVTNRRSRLSSEERSHTKALVQRQSEMQETIYILYERVAELGAQVTNDRVIILKAREDIDIYTKITSNLVEEVARLKERRLVSATGRDDDDGDRGDDHPPYHSFTAGESGN